METENEFRVYHSGDTARAALEPRDVLFDNRIRVDRESIFRILGQATKGLWWMPWHQQAMKDVVSCDKRR
jgi:hypothetical protein